MRDFFRPLFLSFLLFLICQQAVALTLPEALTLAEQHPILKSQDLKILSRQNESADASARGASSLSITSENFGGSQSGFSGLETTLEFSVPIQNSHKIRARKKLAQTGIELSRLEKSAARWVILNQTRRAFHKALAITCLTEKALENIENTEKLLNAARIMVESGAAAEQEEFQAQLLLKQARMDLQSLQSAGENARYDLAIAIGLDSLTDDTIVGSMTNDLELPDPADLEKLAIASNPEIAGKQIEAAEAEAKLELLRAENRPGWSLTAGARNLRESGQNDFLIGFTAELPRARDNKGTRLALKNDIERINLEKKNNERELRLKFQAAHLRFQRLQEQSKKMRDEILPATYHLFELSLEGYQLGKTDQIVVLQAQKDFLSQKETYLQCLDELYKAADSIESLIGPENKTN